MFCALKDIKQEILKEEPLCSKTLNAIWFGVSEVAYFTWGCGVGGKNALPLYLLN